MTIANQPTSLAKITWQDPLSGDQLQEFVLAEGATASIGRGENNDICIPEQHVSRQHAVINFRDGIFMITDLGQRQRHICQRPSTGNALSAGLWR